MGSHADAGEIEKQPMKARTATAQAADMFD
jgi:hypothetical protein